jgi:prevent-host-death family protein
MTTKTVDLGEAQTQFTELVALVKEGAEVIITEDGTPLARLLPIVVTNKPRVAGLNPGAIWISDDFDESLPDKFWLGNS